MFQDMANTEASGIFNVKVATFTPNDESKISMSSANETEIVQLTVWQDFVDSVCFISDSGDYL
jgi:hypothetical protein